LKKLQEEGVDISRGKNGISSEPEPELFFDAMPIWNAFGELSGSRQNGFSMGLIPYSEITNWLTENGIKNLEERNHFRKFINFIDENWVANLNDRKDTPGKQPVTKGKK
jgi:hypothetical protein